MVNTHVICRQMLWQDVDDFPEELYGPFAKHGLCGSGGLVWGVGGGQNNQLNFELGLKVSILL